MSDADLTGRIMMAVLSTVVFAFLLHFSERGMCKLTAGRSLLTCLVIRIVNYLFMGIPGLIANMAMLGDYEFVPAKKSKK
jgi:hypothetical protein